MKKRKKLFQQFFSFLSYVISFMHGNGIVPMRGVW